MAITEPSPFQYSYDFFSSNTYFIVLEAWSNLDNDFVLEAWSNLDNDFQADGPMRNFWGTWLSHREWLDKIREYSKVIGPIVLKPVRLIAQIKRRFDRRMPSWSANRWKSLT